MELIPLYPKFCDENQNILNFCPYMYLLMSICDEVSICLTQSASDPEEPLVDGRAFLAQLAVPSR